MKQRTLSLVRLNLELAKLEAKKKAMALGVAAGLALLAVVLVVYAIGFAFATAAAGCSEALSLWLSLSVIVLRSCFSPQSLDSSPSLRQEGLSSQASTSDRGGGAHSRDRFGAMSSAPSRGSARRSMLNGSASTRISRRSNRRSDRSRVVVAASLVVVALVAWRKGSREGVATVWKLIR